MSLFIAVLQLIVAVHQIALHLHRLVRTKKKQRWMDDQRRKKRTKEWNHYQKIRSEQNKKRKKSSSNWKEICRHWVWTDPKNKVIQLNLSLFKNEYSSLQARSRNLTHSLTILYHTMSRKIYKTQYSPTCNYW